MLGVALFGDEAWVGRARRVLEARFVLVSGPPYDLAIVRADDLGDATLRRVRAQCRASGADFLVVTAEHAPIADLRSEERILESAHPDALLARVGLLLALREARARAVSGRDELELMREVAGVGVFEWWPREGRVRWSPELFALLGHASGAFEPTPQSWDDALVPEDRDAAWEQWRAAVRARRERHDVELRIKSGERTRHVRSLCRVTYAEDGEPAHVMGCVVPLDSPRRDAETAALLERARASERERARLVDLIGHAPAIINYLRGPELVFVVAHPKAEASAGRPLRGLPLLEALPEHRDQPFFPILRRVLETGEPAYLHDVPAKFVVDGVVQESFWRSTYLPVRDETGKVEGVLTFDLDVTDMVRANTERARALERFELAADALEGLVYDLDVASGRVWRSPRGVEHLLGFDEVEESADAWLALIHPDDRAHVDERRGALTDPHRARSVIEYRVRKRDGSYATVVDSALLVRDEQGRVQRILGTTVDVTERKRMAEQTEAALREAERAHGVKDDFFAMLSHELRNPISPILFAANVLRNKLGDMGEIDVIERQAQLLSRIVGDLLDAAHAHRKKLEVHLRPTEVAQALSGALEAARSLVAQKRHDVRVEVPRGLFVRADPARLTQVISNLVINAAKYTPPNGHIDVVATPLEHHVEITVKDDGQGVAPEALSRIFDRFVQETRKEGGLGLGLWIVKTIVELHGGSITVASEGVGRGATFTVRLPRADVAA